MAGLHAALDRLAEVDLDALDDEAQRAITRSIAAAQSRLDGLRLRALGQFDRGGAWTHDGSLTAGAWLARHTPLDAEAARRDVRLARRLGRRPRTAAALEAGTVATGAAALIAGMAEVDHVAFDAVEEAVLDAAGVASRSQLRSALLLWQDQVRDEDVIGATLERQHRDRALHVSRTLGGMVVLDGRFDPIDGAELIELLTAFEQHLYRADRDAAKATSSDQVEQPTAAGSTAAGDEALDGATVDRFERRSPAQRRADALLDLVRAGAEAATRGLGVAARVPACANRVTLLVRADELLGAGDDTGDGTRRRAVPATVGGYDVVLSDEIASFLTCDCFVRTLLHDAFDVPLALGRSRRTPTPALRAALVARDRACAFPGCERPPHWCDAHHIHHWTRGGPTDIDNLVLLCRRHHRMVHGREWSVRIEHDGRPTVSQHGIDQPRNRQGLDPPLRC